VLQSNQIHCLPLGLKYKYVVLTEKPPNELRHILLLHILHFLTTPDELIFPLLIVWAEERTCSVIILTDLCGVCLGTHFGLGGGMERADLYIFQAVGFPEVFLTTRM
jgi:hypothetical protein